MLLRTALVLTLKNTFSLGIAICLLAVALLTACTEAPTWQRLLTLKITKQYPDYIVETSATGSLLVARPGKSTLPVDAEAIGRFCQRGPKDCNYATDQMLLELGGK